MGCAGRSTISPGALQALEILAAPVVEEPPLATPPSSPLPGSCYVVAANPSGAWSGKAGCLAAFTSGGWKFVTPADGMTVYVRSTGTRAIHVDGTWALSGGPIESPSGGTTIDTQARSAVDQILDALRQHGIIAA